MSLRHSAQLGFGCTQDPFLRGMPRCLPGSLQQPGYSAGQSHRQPLHPVPRSQSGPPHLAQTDRDQRSLRSEMHGMSSAASTHEIPMKNNISRRQSLLRMGGTFLGLVALSAARVAKATVQTVFVSTTAPRGYDPAKHKWLM